MFSLENVPQRDRDFTINQLDFRVRYSDEPDPEVPEPGTYAFVAGLVVAATLFRLRRKR